MTRKIFLLTLFVFSTIFILLTIALNKNKLITAKSDLKCEKVANVCVRGGICGEQKINIC